ncbi:MAG TPA: hypothetical protein VMV52_10580 [Candidatus Nanopelagicaceae bacterium]|nr:hypothetical protein [Candidatus Nanopelagicaceae bacterium]
MEYPLEVRHGKLTSGNWLCWLWEVDTLKSQFVVRGVADAVAGWLVDGAPQADISSVLTMSGTKTFFT